MRYEGKISLRLESYDLEVFNTVCKNNVQQPQAVLRRLIKMYNRDLINICDFEEPEDFKNQFDY